MSQYSDFKKENASDIEQLICSFLLQFVFMNA